MSTLSLSSPSSPLLFSPSSSLSTSSRYALPRVISAVTTTPIASSSSASRPIYAICGVTPSAWSSAAFSGSPCEWPLALVGTWTGGGAISGTGAGTGTSASLNTLTLHALVTLDDSASLRALSSPSSPSFTLATADHIGDVHDLACLSPHTYLTASSSGHVNVYQLAASSSQTASSSSPAPLATLQRVHAWNENASVTGVSVHPHTSHLFATCNEAGQLSLYDASAQARTHRIDHAGSSALTAIQYVDAFTVLTASMSGRIALWDVRAPTATAVAAAATPSATFHAPGFAGLTALAAHASRRGTIAAGSVDGDLFVWDATSSSSPTLPVFHAPSLHDVCPVRDVLFVPFDPSVVLSVGDDGALNMLDFNVQRSDPSLFSFASASSAASASASSAASTASASPPVERACIYHDRLPLNALGVERETNTIVAASDSQLVASFQYRLAPSAV